MSSYYSLTNLNRNIVVVILTLLLVVSVGGQVTAQEELADSRFDLSNNGMIDDVDADMLLRAWASLQQDGLCVTPQLVSYDFNGDGCINVFDAQLLLTHWGERTRPEPSPGRIDTAATFTFVVNSSADKPDLIQDNGVCDTGNTVTVSGNSYAECTLRAAIEEANNHHSGPDIINFNIRNSDGSCPGLVTIQLDGSLPTTLTIDDWADTDLTINGYTQCGASPNTKQVGGNASIKIQVRGVGSGSKNGLDIHSANNVIKGLALYNSWRDIDIRTGGATNNTIQGNILGSNVSFSSGAFGYGLVIGYGGSYNLIGGPEPAHRNFFGKSTREALAVSGKGNPVEFNVIINNYIGVRQDGKTSSGVIPDGLDISYGARYNWFGASPPPGWPPPGWQEGDPVPPPDPDRVYDPRERNIISNNGRDGIEVSHGTDTQYNYIVNNYIGLSASGTQVVANGEQGIGIEDMPNRNYYYDNVISGNKWNGIESYGITDYSYIVDNYIGVGPDGVTPMPNGTDPNPEKSEYKAGIWIYNGAQYSLIKNNVIANHPGEGIIIAPITNWNSSTYESMGRNPKATYFNTISQNSLYNNQGLGINLTTNSPYVGNQGLPAPQITSAILPIVEGTACPNCIVEVFVAATNDSADTTLGGEGKIFIGSGTTDGAGNFSIVVSGSLGGGDKATATATDALGNTSEFGPNVDIVDNEPPTGGVLLNGGTNLESPYSNVLAQFSGQDNFAVTDFRYRFDNPDLTGISWNAVSAPAATILEEKVVSLSNGPHTIYAQYKDIDDNQSGVYNATITIVDVGGSPSAGITINNGANVTNDPNLSLQLIGPLYSKDMKVSDDPALNGSNWEPYAVQRSWALNDPYSGTQSFNYTVYAKYKDANDSETSIVNDAILYDPVAPTLVTSFNSDTKLVDLTGTQDDVGGSGLAKMRFYDQANPGHDTGWISYQTTYSWPWSGDDKIVIQAKDEAGNISTSLPGGSIYLPIILR